VDIGDRMKNWFSKNRKSILVGTIFFVICVTIDVVMGVTCPQVYFILGVLFMASLAIVEMRQT